MQTENSAICQELEIAKCGKESVTEELRNAEMQIDQLKANSTKDNFELKYQKLKVC